MSQNPFEGLGGGGFDMGALLQQAQQMQEQLASAQERLAEQTVDGTVAGGAVTVTVNGVGELVGLAITAGQFDGSDTDDLSDLSDMVIAAREALERSRTEPSSDEPRVDHAALADAAADPDDPDADTQGLDSTALLQQTLGAKVSDEIRHT